MDIFCNETTTVSSLTSVNVEIGTSAGSTAPLQLYGASNQFAIYVNSSTQFASMYFVNSGTSSAYMGMGPVSYPANYQGNVYVQSPTSIVFNVNGNGANTGTAMFINTSGHVGIGSASPGTTLDVNGTIRVNNTLQFTGGSGGTQTLTAGASSSVTNSAPFIHSNYDLLVGWSYNPNGNSYNDLGAQSGNDVQGQGIALRAASNSAMIQICTNYVAHQVIKVGTAQNHIMIMYHVASVPANPTIIGSITHTASSVSYNTTSDGRRKTNITDMPSIISKIKQLKPRYYNWKETGDKDSGFIAQEVHKVFPQFITVGLTSSTICRHTESDLFDGNLCTCCDFENPVDKDGKPHYYGLDYGKFTPYLTKALQETIDMVEAQAKRIEALEAQVTALLQK